MFLDRNRLNHIAIAQDSAVAETEAAFETIDAWMVKRMLERLYLDYPGWHWECEARHAQGAAWVRFVSFTDWQEFIKLMDLKGDPMLKAVTRAGGRFLERFRLPRGPFNEDRYHEALKRYYPHFTRGLRPPD